jgi:hypothetical protein
MSRMKYYAEEVSIDMGLGGELTDEVLAEAGRRLKIFDKEQHMIDPTEFAIQKLEYLHARIETIERLARSTDHTQMRCDAALESIAGECRYLLSDIDKIREALDPELSR